MVCPLNDAWEDRSVTPPLAEDEVHVWRVRWRRFESLVPQLSQSLSSEERSRSERFHFERDRLRFIVAHGALRSIIGGYIDAAPDSCGFSCGPQGKPFLEDRPPLASVPLRFNLSDSGDLVLIAVTRGRELGVDVEFVRSLSDDDQVPERFFSPAEVQALRALPEATQHHAFFTCWTRKEAYIKAKGGGLSIPLDQFDVSLGPGETPRLLHVGWDPEEADHWRMVELRPGKGYVAALIAEGHDWRLKRYDWREQEAER